LSKMHDTECAHLYIHIYIERERETAIGLGDPVPRYVGLGAGVAETSSPARVNKKTF